MSQTTLHIAEQDNVMVALRLIAGGTEVDGVTVASDVPAGHKIATRPIPAGADRPQVRLSDWRRDARHRARRARPLAQPDQHAARRLRPVEARHAPAQAAGAGRARRSTASAAPDGRVGIRNEIWIVNTVGCVNNAAERIAAAARNELEAGADWGSVDGVHAFPHQFGCSQLGDDLDLTQKILAGPGPPPERGRRADPRARLREQPDEADARGGRQDRARARRVLQRAGGQRRGRGGDRAHPQAGRVRGQGEARADPGQGADPGDEVRRQRRAVAASPPTRWSARSPTASPPPAAPCC